MLLEAVRVRKIYGKKHQTVALKEVSFGINKGEFVAIMGESGSGKSTLLNIIATYDVPSAGYVLLNGSNLLSLEERELASFRRKEIGFVFQDFNVLNTFSNEENIILPLVLMGYTPKNIKTRLDEIVKKLGIEEILNKFPYEISGGQRQRVAIARALIGEPSIILADEPTGALDSKTSSNIMELFDVINRDGQTVLMVTHSIKSAAYATRVLFIKDGMVFHELYKGEKTNRQFESVISDSIARLSGEGW